MQTMQGKCMSNHAGAHHQHKLVSIPQHSKAQASTCLPRRSKRHNSASKSASSICYASSQPLHSGQRASSIQSASTATPQLIVPGTSSNSKSLHKGASALILPGAQHTSHGRSSTRAPQAATVEMPVTSTSAKDKAPYIYVDGQRVHSMSEHGLEVITSMGDWASSTLMRYLKPAERNWQPTDFLPDPASPDFYDQVQALRKAAAELPWEYLVVLVGDMVTEEALPSYMNMLNTLDGTKDETGSSPTPWACWTREWTAEENRHGDLLNKYLYLCGRVDMRAIEVTIQRLIGSGLDPQLENNPYLCFVYTSFQERATKVSHGSTARQALQHGDGALAKLCGAIAADEGRHEQAYQAIVGELFNRDPDGAMLAFADMMKKGIVMPAHFVDDGWHGQANAGGNLFVDYATVADAIGVYTTQDYADIVTHLVSRWKVADRAVVSGEAAEAQEYLCKHADRIRRLADLQAERRQRDKRRGRHRAASFSWIGKREIELF